ncbi:MAG TPA: alpha/beta hydrolase [Novosphingobium sp.]|nr:alpha/beta hydrolase [Novosphingobium sp.]
MNRHMSGAAQPGAAEGQEDVLVLTVPGLNNSGPEHWQSLWEQQRGDCLRVELGQWDRPHRNSWVNNLNLAIRAAEGPVYLAAHSLGCLAVAWWAQMEPKAAQLVAGALLVAPPEVDFTPEDPRLVGFSPTPCAPLPFPSVLVASSNDPYMDAHAARYLARMWGAEFVNVGRMGHINACSQIGDWPQGQALLDGLIAQGQRLRARQTTTSQGWAARP